MSQSSSSSLALNNPSHHKLRPSKTSQPHESRFIVLLGWLVRLAGLSRVVHRRRLLIFLVFFLLQHFFVHKLSSIPLYCSIIKLKKVGNMRNEMKK
jgi:hypothetical protein